MSNFVERLQDAVKRAACQALNASEAFGNAIVFAWQQGTGLTNVNPPNFAGIAKGLLCGIPSPQLPPSTSVPQAAQCNCVEYSIDGYLTRNGQANLYFSNRRFYGELVDIVPVSGGFIEPFVTTYNLVCRGEPPTPCGSLQQISIGAGASDGSITSYVISRVRRVDGLPDDCGVVPPPVTEPLPPTGLPGPDITFIYNPDSTTNLSIPVVLSPIFFQPRFNFNGQIIIPFELNLNIDLGGVNFNLTGNLNINTGDINFNFGNGGNYKQPGFDSPCDEDTEPVREVEEPVLPLPPPPEDPDVDEETVIVAVLVRVTSASLQRKATLIVQGTNPNIYAPALGFVNFYVPVGGGTTRAWLSDIPVKNTYQLIPCPWDLGAVGVSGTPNPGVSWQLTPIKRRRPKTIVQDA